MGLFSRRRPRGPAALRHMPVAPGVGKVRAHKSAGAMNIRFDGVKGSAPEAALTRMLGVEAGQARVLSQRAWDEGEKFRTWEPLLEAGGPAPGSPPAEREVRRLDLGERVALFAVEAEAGGGLGRTVPVFWTDLTHTCEPTWARRSRDHLVAWVEGNVDSPGGSEPLGFEALDFSWHGSLYLRGAAMPLEIAGVAETFHGQPAPEAETLKAVVHGGGRAGDPDEFEVTGTVLAVTEAPFEGGRGFVVRLQVAPIEWVEVWAHERLLSRIPREGEGARALVRLIGMWAGQRTADLAVG
jgi:hypothetical protein